MAHSSGLNTVQIHTISFLLLVETFCLLQDRYITGFSRPVSHDSYIDRASPAVCIKIFFKCDGVHNTVILKKNTQKTLAI